MLWDRLHERKWKTTWWLEEEYTGIGLEIVVVPVTSRHISPPIILSNGMNTKRPTGREADRNGGSNSNLLNVTVPHCSDCCCECCNWLGWKRERWGSALFCNCIHITLYFQLLSLLQQLFQLIQLSLSKSEASILWVRGKERHVSWTFLPSEDMLGASSQRNLSKLPRVMHFSITQCWFSD